MEVILPDDIGTIGARAFENWSELKTIDVGSSLTTIGNRAFSGCTSLTSINLPTFITSIGNYALSGCSALTEVIINATTPPTLGTGVFPAGVTVRVPATSWTAYITAWPGISILTIQ